MPSFSHHFQNPVDQKANRPKFGTETLSLSMLLQYAENAKKQSFEALCHLQPLVKSYRDKVAETSQAMIEAESSLGNEAEIPETYSSALSLVKQGFSQHIEALDMWMGALARKDSSRADQAAAETKQTGGQLETALQALSTRG